MAAMARPRFQFSIRWLLGATAVVAVLCAATTSLPDGLRPVAGLLVIGVALWCLLVFAVAFVWGIGLYMLVFAASIILKVGEKMMGLAGQATRFLKNPR